MMRDFRTISDVSVPQFIIIAGEVIASISVSGNCSQLSLERCEEIAPEVVKIATEISKKMGYVS